MERYEAYKDSGVEWVGAIPISWQVVRNKYVFSCSKDIVGDEWVTTQLLSLTTRGITTKDINNAEGKLPENYDGYQIVRKNDLVMCLFDLDLSAVFSGLSRTEGMISPAYKVLATRAAIPSFAKYWFDFVFQGRKFAHYSKSLRSTLTFDEFGTLPFLRPCAAEQQTIADYLDAKTAEIDSLIADCEREVELLQEYRKAVVSEAVTKGLDPDAPMKDSGIEWIGKIPRNWRTARTKQVCCKITDGTHFSPSIVDEGYPYITATNIRGRGIDYSSTKLISKEAYNQLVQNGCRPRLGDVLMVKDGATTGRAGLMTDDKPCVILSSVALMRPIPICHSDYLFYCIQSTGFQKQVLVSMAGSAMPRTTLDKLVEYAIALPPFPEQVQISDYLDARTIEIDSLIEAKRSMAEKLREYRRSLISEAVTGQFKVPGVQ